MISVPPLGWSSWNKFHCGINETLIKGVADAVVDTGLAKYYNHINLDDCWMDKARTANGMLQGDRDTFPSGMKALGDYIHGKGLKYGLYLDPGTLTCQRRPGSFQHEADDARYLASVGCDYLKHDACYSSDAEQLYTYFTMRDALNATGRPIGYSVCPNDARCNDPKQVMWDASSVANVNMCRGDAICRDIGLPGRPPEVTERVLRRPGRAGRASGPDPALAPRDIVPTWHSWLCMLDVQVTFDSMRYAGPGHYIMPDMLEVGNGMAAHEDRAHFSMWSMIAAPLITGHDVRAQTAETLETLTNPEVIAINQDRAGKPARRVQQQGGYTGVDTWVRQLDGGDYAVALFNRGNSSAANITLDWADIGLPPAQPAALRDVWARRELGQFTASFTAQVPPHSVTLLRATQMPGPSFDTAAASVRPCAAAGTADSFAQRWTVGPGNSPNQSSLRAAGLCLDLYDCDLERAANLQVYACHGPTSGCGALNQGFIFDSSGAPTAIRSAVNHSYCLTLVPAANGTVIASQPCEAAGDPAAQLFVFAPVATSAGQYVVRHSSSAGCLTA
eukprot:g3368.t1